jgi:DNA-binding HxlR family transcriptional regulator
VYLGAAVGAHAVACRLPLSGTSFGKFLGVGGALGLGLAGHLAAVYGAPVESLAALLVYAFVCELYIFMFTLVISSVSASILVTLDGSSLTEEEIGERLGGEAMLSLRIERLRAAGLLEATVTGYRVTDKGRRLLGAWRSLRRFFRHAG